MDPTVATQIEPYQPWLIISGVCILFILLRVTRQGLRERIDEIGYRLLGERGQLIWFWINAPGVIIHELSHAIIILLFKPFGFRIIRITPFRKPELKRGRNGRVMSSNYKQSLKLGEVHYVRPPERFMSYVGDGLSAIAPLYGGLAMLSLLYWIATGYNLWEIHLQLVRPGWPWWTLLFAPYLILTVTSELWPSSVDWKGGRTFVLGLLIFATLILTLLWLTKYLVFNDTLLQTTASLATHIDFILLVLLILDIIFLIFAEVLLRALRRH